MNFLESSEYFYLYSDQFVHKKQNLETKEHFNLHLSKMSGNQQRNSGGAGGGEGRMPRDMKDLLKICAEMSTNTEGQTQNEANSFQNMSAEVSKCF